MQSSGADSGQRVQRSRGYSLRVHEATAHAAVHGVVRWHGAVEVQQAAGEGAHPAGRARKAPARARG